MKKRIFYSITGVTLASIFIFNIVIAFFMYESFFELEKNRVKQESNQILNYITQNNGQVDSLNSITRITIISNDGTVIFDNYNDKNIMDNHKDRPEIKSAFEHGIGEETRLSDTLNKQTYYYAVKLDDFNVLRLSITVDSVYSMLFESLPSIIIISIIFIFLSILISEYLTRKIIEPIDKGRFDDNIYDELAPFISKINNQNKRIIKQREELIQKTSDFNVITENIADGLILINQKSEIISINKKAKRILGDKNIDYVSKNIIELNRNLELKNAINNTLSGENSQIEMKIASKVYILHISPVYNNTFIRGVVILIVDNTKNAMTEQIRREFSANVSHELKTPLTSISGYAELIKEGLVQEKDVKVFAENIYNEAHHLINLIEDIIKISKLDEQQKSLDFVKIRLDEVVFKVIQRLEKRSKEKNIAISTELFETEIMGIPHIIEEIFYNIIENSIKYNKDDGEVHISFEKSNKYTIIAIKDTGIGVSEESLDRIFERFYRDDKSHNKEISGTGLGLSIVKHSVNLHKGKIEVSSKIGKGTTFRIYLPNVLTKWVNRGIL